MNILDHALVPEDVQPTAISPIEGKPTLLAGEAPETQTSEPKYRQYIPIRPKQTCSQESKNILQEDQHDSFQCLPSSLAGPIQSTFSLVSQQAPCTFPRQRRRLVTSQLGRKIDCGGVPQEFCTSFQSLGHPKPMKSRRKRVFKASRAILNTCFRCKEQHLKVCFSPII